MSNRFLVIRAASSTPAPPPPLPSLVARDSKRVEFVNGKTRNNFRCYLDYVERKENKSENCQRFAREQIVFHLARSAFVPLLSPARALSFTISNVVCPDFLTFFFLSSLHFFLLCGCSQQLGKQRFQLKVNHFRVTLQIHANDCC